METNRKAWVRHFHEAKWDEPIVFELSRKGERGILVPEVVKEIEECIGDGISILPEHVIRKKPPALPEIAQTRVLRHYLRLSQETLGADINIDIGQGTCTMKYSPKINEVLARSPKVTELHPLQDESTIQGALEIMYKLDSFLRDISGFSRFTFQPAGGSHAIFTIASIISAYHELNGEGEKRDEIITTLLSHPSTAAAPAVKGYKMVTIYPDEDGLSNIEALKAAVSERTAGLIVTNPEDTAIFNPRIAEFTKIVHEVGGLCAYDQANANGIIGIIRAVDCGFDLGFFNLHKTFSSPHGCGGPAVGAVGVRQKLVSFLPVPLVDLDGEKYYLNYNVPHTIGKVREFYGVFPVIFRAYAWIRSLGAEGIKEVARVAVLNNNYVMKKIMKEVKGASISFPRTKHRIEQVRYSWEQLTKDTGVTTEDIIRRMTDFGFHLWTSHHPWIVPQPFTIEPTESYSKDELDEYIATLKKVAEEAYKNPKKAKNSPYRSTIHKINPSPLNDPKKWAITWRAYLKKRKNWDE